MFTFGQRRSVARERRRLAREVRAYAQAEHEQYHQAGVLELDSVAARAALYERVAERIEDISRPVAEESLRRLENLIAESPPVRDYGPRAQDRNELIAAILADLEES
jgi:cell fate (sporulation/competence/biofilm development) regulator YmcA (YheA/YmcA/DUF963 family)